MKTISEVRNSYNLDYKSKKFGGPGRTHGWILDLLKVGSNKKLLDIGCGQGLLVKEASQRGLVTYAVDISGEAVMIARGNSPQSEITCNDAQKLNWPDEYFDYITNIGSLEHFTNPEGCLNEMHRALKPNGVIAVMLPNLYYYRHILDKLFKGKQPTSHQPIERFAKKKIWQSLLERHGFKITKIHKYNKFNRSMLEIWLRNIIVPLQFSHHFVFICEKRKT